MQRNWTQRLFAWLQSELNRNPVSVRRSSRRSRYDQNRRGAMIGQFEVLESRRLLTNVVAVTVNAGAVSLNDVSAKNVSTGDSFDVSYTSTQVVLTGHNGTVFRVGGADQATFTATVSSPVSLKMSLNSHGNTVNVTGDGTADLTSLNVNLSNGKANNSLTLTSVVADSVSIKGGRGNDVVTFRTTTVNDDLNVNLRQHFGDILQLSTTTVKGNVVDSTGQLIMDHSTITGTLKDHQGGKQANFSSSDSTYTGAVTAWMGPDAVINMIGSPDGPNHFHSSETLRGPRGHKPTLYEATGAVVNDVAPTLRNVNVKIIAAAFSAPTVVSHVAATATPKITGTYDSANTSFLRVTANGKTYTLGTDAQLTSPSAGNWSLDLAGAPLTAQINTVTAASTDKIGNTKTATGTITNEQSIISSFLTKNSLTATMTASGLNTVLTTPGMGALPTNGQTLTVNYTGHILKADGTLGAEFDSNVDPQFNHVTPFTFKLGTGAVIKGWDEAFALLKVGSVAKLIIPSSLAYGTAGSSSGTVPIPANSILVFDVTLVSAV